MSVVGSSRAEPDVDERVCHRCATPSMLDWLRGELSAGSFAACFSAAEERPGGVLALQNAFLRGFVAKRYGDEFRRYAALSGIDRAELVVDPALAPAIGDEADDDLHLPAVGPPRVQELPPGLTTRLFAERAFWLMSPLAPGRVLELTDLRGRLRVEAGAQGSCGTYEAMVLAGLLAIWGDGPRVEPIVECGLRRLSTVLGLAWGGRTASQLSTAIERLKSTTYRTTIADDAAGRELVFSLLDEIQTTWVGPPTSTHRHVRAVFSRATWDAVSAPRILRVVDLDALRTLGPRRELARRLLYLLDAQPGHEVRPGLEIVERVVDERLVASLGTARPVWKVAQALRVAGAGITEAAPRYRCVELVPRRKRSLAPGAPRLLLHVVRMRESKNKRRKVRQ